MQVEHVMSKSVHCCRPEDSLEKAAGMMWDQDCGCLPVRGGDGDTRLAGMITDRDIAMCALFQGKTLNALRVADAMAREARCCHPEDSIDDARDLMRAEKLRRLPVVDALDNIVGMISLVDLAREATKERSTQKKDVTDRDISDTLVAICAPAGASQAAP